MDISNIRRNNVSTLSVDSAPGLYQSRHDGSIAIKGDSNGKKKGNRPSIPATQVTVVSGTNGRTFIKDIAKLTDQYDFIADLRDVVIDLA